ncbi:hypothetical protein GCM10025865_21050 [Paraoerskovia sediminicola]|uniref:Glutamate/phenylalanine/leucine/valine/L-tryptophan dehydrogenase C-terminal domain-containing protein n=1 Tax=Paraoerskovia sediminicola TaxID=1138587 RepID=A0ABM8G440_9CELL|nr:hypothetical protein GCM10025865_21050 [Paraoerskovia sediminicola]
MGAHAAQIFADEGAVVVAVSDQYGGVTNPAGLDVAELLEHVAATGTVVGFEESDEISNTKLLGLEVDVLVPAAVEGVLDEITAQQVRARFVVEGANGPTTGEGDRILAKNGVVVVPDVLANAGGVIVSYFEWVQANQAYWWTEGEIAERLEHRMHSAYADVSALARKEDVSLRDSALAIGVQRVAEAHEIRGLYP